MAGFFIEEIMSDEADTIDNEDDSPEVIAEAKSLGWKSPDEWKGEPPKNGFVKAKEYVERGKHVLPIVRSQLEKSEREREALEVRLAKLESETTDKISRMDRMSKVALQRQRESIERQYEAAKEAAIEVGDKDAYRQADKASKEALKEFDEAAEDKVVTTKKDLDEPAKDLPADVKKTISAWTKDNTWYDDDEDLRVIATNYHGKLLKDKPHLTLERNLEEVSKYINDKYRKKVEAAEEEDEEEDERPRRSRVESGSRGGGSAGGSSFSKLPVDARKQADRFIKEEGLFLEKGETAETHLNKARERYAAQYLEDQA
jgi:hypothetical protein